MSTTWLELLDSPGLQAGVSLWLIKLTLLLVAVLPEVPIELMAYKNNPGDTQIKYITRIRPS